MAAGEDESQPIVRNFAPVEVWLVDDLAGKELGMSLELFLQASLPSQTIDGFVFCCLNDPGAGRFGNAVRAPLIDGGGKCFLRGVFGEFEIAKLADQSGYDAAPVRPVDRVDSDIGVGKHV
jgi:hypothetical protein